MMFQVKQLLVSGAVCKRTPAILRFRRTTPPQLRQKKNAAPYRCKLRQNSPEKSEILEAFNKKLVELGWVYENRESLWCCPALPVKKPSTNDYRRTMDYRPANALTEPIAGLPLHESCREYLSYMTDKGVFTPIRVPHGSNDAALHFQSTVGMVLGDLVGKCVITADQLVESIDAILQKLDEHGFILNPKKCSLLLTEVRWCGRIINKDGIGHDPIRIQALREMSPPTTAAELQRFICASSWMSAGLVDYSRVARPLQERLDIALAGTKKAKRAATGI
ncbi:Hypothetical protein PHPALM_5161 [Phytophthora palmivora]|uniref:Reverse transcriptase domain-containing protein n=1 Tax=Phytophthora palmivora TaxID=4796 RepID=A0A2P4YI15_9STRA|nr:Hypothetical protein PHPALM_5161 [Phytophthora palmivora]